MEPQQTGKPNRQLSIEQLPMKKGVFQPLNCITPSVPHDRQQNYQILYRS